MFVTHLENSFDGTRVAADRLRTTHEGRPLLVRYDLEAVRKAVPRDSLAARPADLWRYRELLPLRDDVVSLGEERTPLLHCPRLGAELKVPRLWVKDESRLPTGSFKARGMALAISLARSFGVERVGLPTQGNAGGAAAAYAARAGIACHVVMPRDTPVVNRKEAELLGAEVTLVDGLIHDCAAVVRGLDCFDLSTLKEPYRLEGKKTMGLELADQLGWKLPDAIFYPTGGGTGLIGMWKAFGELWDLGWLDSETMPRMYACQSDGCAPIADAFAKGERFAAPPSRAETVASGLRVPKALGDFLILDAVQQSGGAALAAPEAEIPQRMRRAAALEGISFCPETAACLLAVEAAARDGRIRPEETVVVFNTGAGQKYVEVL